MRGVIHCVKCKAQNVPATHHVLRFAPIGACCVGYQYADELPLPIRNWPTGVRRLMRRNAESPIYLAQHRDFRVVYTHLTGDHLSRTVERPIVEPVQLDQLASDAMARQLRFNGPAEEIAIVEGRLDHE